MFMDDELSVSGKSGALVVSSIGQTNKGIRHIDYEAIAP
jgi:hypothetical protein